MSSAYPTYFFSYYPLFALIQQYKHSDRSSNSVNHSLLKLMLFLFLLPAVTSYTLIVAHFSFKSPSSLHVFLTKTFSDLVKESCFLQGTFHNL